jgi:hypothetical protein
MFNEPEEGRVWSQMGPSLYDFTSPGRVNSMVFSYLESLKRFRKKTPDGIFCKFSLPSLKKYKIIPRRTLLTE